MEGHPVADPSSFEKYFRHSEEKGEAEEFEHTKQWDNPHFLNVIIAHWYSLVALVQQWRLWK